MSTPPNIPSGSNLYSQGFGSTPSASLVNAVRATRSPASTDIKGASGNYVIGQRWINTSSNLSFTLTNITSSGGSVSATWTQEGGTGSGDVTSVSGTANQISVSPTTGAVVVGLTSSIIVPGSVTAGTGVSAASGNVVATAGQVVAGGDTGGGGSTISLTNSNSTTIGAGTGTVKMSSGNNADSAVWIKVYVGATAYWVPGWTTNSP